MSIINKMAIAVAAAGLSVSASAAVITSEFGLPVTENTTEINVTGALDKFDASLGTLTSAVLEVFGASTQAFDATNNAAQMQTSNITSSVDLLFSSDLGPDPLAGMVLTFSNSTGFLGYDSGQTQMFGPFNDSGSMSTAVALGLVTGAGMTFNVNCESFSGIAIQGGGGNISTNQSTQAGCGARITYTFDDTPPPNGDVPVPGTLALVGLGLLAARRATKKAA